MADAKLNAEEIKEGKGDIEAGIPSTMTAWREDKPNAERTIIDKEDTDAAGIGTEVSAENVFLTAEARKAV